MDKALHFADFQAVLFHIKLEKWKSEKWKTIRATKFTQMKPGSCSHWSKEIMATEVDFKDLFCEKIASLKGFA